MFKFKNIFTQGNILFQNVLALKVKNLLLHFSSEHSWSFYLVSDDVGKAINMTKEPPAFTEVTQMETGDKQRDTKYHFGS